MDQDLAGTHERLVHQLHGLGRTNERPHIKGNCVEAASLLRMTQSAPPKKKKKYNDEAWAVTLGLCNTNTVCCYYGQSFNQILVKPSMRESDQ